MRDFAFWCVEGGGGTIDKSYAKGETGKLVRHNRGTAKDWADEQKPVVKNSRCGTAARKATRVEGKPSTVG